MRSSSTRIIITDARTDGRMDGWSEETEERARCWNGLYIEIEKRMSEPGEFPKRSRISSLDHTRKPGKPANPQTQAHRPSQQQAMLLLLLLLMSRVV